MTNAKEVVTKARNAFNTGITKPYEFRLKQIKALIRMVDENEDLLVNAIIQDVRKPKFEAGLHEIIAIKYTLKHIMYNLKEWMEPVKPGKPLPFLFDEVLILSEPYGVALVIGTWNYPMNLTLNPIAGAIAAGNTVILKPSEVTPKCAALLKDLFSKYLDPNCYHVFIGGIPETTELLDQRFDYIFYSGGCQTGKIIHQAASKYLTPTTLELGGKTPVYIDNSVNIDLVAARIMFGKTINSGQSCIAPDYVLCTKEIQQKFIIACRNIIKNWYKGDVKHSPDYARVINERNFQRIVKLLVGTNIAIGGSYDVDDLYVEPTIVINVKEFDPVMQEEIFGPILAILNVADANEAVHFINNREKPLVIYLFSKDTKTQNLFMNNTSSGNLLMNDTMMHASCDTIPFGGVGNSGMGRYHGKYSFDTFSHQKGTMIRSLDKFSETLQKIRYPPYTKNNMKLIMKGMRKLPPIPGSKYFSGILIFLCGFFIALFIQHLIHLF